MSLGLYEGDDGPCQACGEKYPAWRAPNELWNLVMGGPDAKGDPGGMLCPTDFLRAAELKAPQRGAWVVGTPVRPESVVKAEALDELAPVVSFLREVLDPGLAEHVPMHIRAEADQVLVEVFNISLPDSPAGFVHAADWKPGDNRPQCAVSEYQAHEGPCVPRTLPDHPEDQFYAPEKYQR